VGKKATLEIQRGKQTISYQIPVSEKLDLQERLADLVTTEQANIPQLGILAFTLDEKLMSMLPPLRNRFGVEDWLRMSGSPPESRTAFCSSVIASWCICFSCVLSPMANQFDILSESFALGWNKVYERRGMLASETASQTSVGQRSEQGQCAQKEFDRADIV